MQISDKTTKILVATIATILVVAALRATKPISMPLAFAFFVVVLVYPSQAWLEQRLPRWLSLILVLLVLAGVLGIAVSALVLSVEIIEPQIPQYLEQLQQMGETLRSWL